MQLFLYRSTSSPEHRYDLAISGSLSPHGSSNIGKLSKYLVGEPCLQDHDALKSILVGASVMGAWGSWVSCSLGHVARSDDSVINARPPPYHCFQFSNVARGSSISDTLPVGDHITL